MVNNYLLNETKNEWMSMYRPYKRQKQERFFHTDRV